MSRAVLHAARGSRPAVPGRGATAPKCVRPTSCRAAGGGNAHLATHHQNLNAASNSTLPWPHPEPSGRGRPDGWRTRGAGLVLELAP